MESWVGFPDPVAQSCLRPLISLLPSAQIWPPVQIANFYFVPLAHR